MKSAFKHWPRWAILGRPIFAAGWRH